MVRFNKISQWNQALGYLVSEEEDACKRRIVPLVETGVVGCALAEDLLPLAHVHCHHGAGVGRGVVTVVQGRKKYAMTCTHKYQQSKHTNLKKKRKRIPSSHVQQPEFDYRLKRCRINMGVLPL